MVRLPFVLLGLLVGCVSNTNISYFPDQRGPFHCTLIEDGDEGLRRNQDFEQVTVQNWPDVFVIRNPKTNEVVVLANNMRVISAQANPKYQSKWGKRKISYLKLLLVVEVDADKAVFEEVYSDLAVQYPGAVLSESIATDIVVDIYSIWLGSEYTRAPCDGVALDNIPIEITLPSDDAAQFLSSAADTMQLAGRVLYRDSKSGWNFHRSFSVKRQDFKVLN